MTNYAGRYGSGPQIKPGGLAMAVVATVLPLAGLVAGLQINNIIHPKDRTTLIKVDETRKPPPEPLKKVPPKEQQDTKITVPPIPIPQIPDKLPPIDLTPAKPSEPPPMGNIGKAPEPAPLPAPEPVKPPVIVGAQIASMSALQPPYPSDMIRSQTEGRVVVRVLIGPDGRVKQVEKVSATNDSFYGAVERQAMGRWRFKPATRDGAPFEQWKTMSLRFELNGE